jgi:uncharacterized protein
MLGIAVQLAISWLVLWLTYRLNLEALGLLPNRRRLLDLAFGLLLGVVGCGSFFGLAALAAERNITLNPLYTLQHFGSAAGWHLRSVIFEELIFRGALLYVLIRKLGATKACLISAAAFGIYHWFTMGALGNPIMMLVLFLFTGFYGVLFALSFARTGSLYLPIALHFGWNLVQAIAFTQGKGEQLLLMSGGHLFGMALSALLLAIPFACVPTLLYLYLKRRNKIAPAPLKECPVKARPAA